jgi:hypothetical protein
MIVRKDEFIRRYERLGNKEHRITHNNGTTYTHEVWEADAHLHHKHKDASYMTPPAHPHHPDDGRPYTEEEIDRIISQQII